MNSVKCYYCGESYSGDIQQHMKDKHYFQCKYCDKLYLTVKEIEDHHKTQHLKCKCAHCGANYTSKEQLKLHFKAKHCIECPDCTGKSFISIDDLNFHYRYTHLTVECYYCNSYFRSKQELEQHIKIKHCFECPGCSESFKSIELRNFHDKNVHLKIECPHCCILFRKDEHLQKHIQDQHKSVCRWCKKSFTYPHAHEANFHQGCIYVTFDCSYCTSYFPTDKQLEKHSEIHHR